MRSYPPDPGVPWYESCMYSSRSSGRFDRCLLTLGQIESLLYRIKELRSERRWVEADELRDKLIAVGYTYTIPNVLILSDGLLNWNDLKGRIFKGLDFQIGKDGHISVRGYIHEHADRPGSTTEIIYSTTP